MTRLLRLLRLLREARQTAAVVLDYAWTAFVNKHCECHCTHRATHNCEGK